MCVGLVQALWSVCRTVCTMVTTVCVRLYCQAIVNRFVELTSFLLPLLLLHLLLPLLLLLPQVFVAVPREVEVG